MASYCWCIKFGIERNCKKLHQSCPTPFLVVQWRIFWSNMYDTHLCFRIVWSSLVLVEPGMRAHKLAIFFCNKITKALLCKFSAMRHYKEKSSMSSTFICLIKANLQKECLCYLIIIFTSPMDEPFNHIRINILLTIGDSNALSVVYKDFKSLSTKSPMCCKVISISEKMAVTFYLSFFVNRLLDRL